MTNLPVLNRELLEQVADYAAEHVTPDYADATKWDQRRYRSVLNCGTTLCLAGIACTLAGGRWADKQLMIEHLYAEPEDTYTIEYQEDLFLTPAANRAQQLLGLTDDERVYLFAGTYNEVEELRMRVKRVLNGELR